MTVEEGQMSAEDLLATVCTAAGIDHKASQIDENGRPIRITDGTPTKAVLS